ncbi:hypothetical protein TNCV_3118581 [Trichonephila clavipes]|uniref:Uncharacterized protein n=1 Tax=Trichonephila clavipes TaxID=2585209 RepID=A0A8X6W970_TRICX|nr:hypothetical protein TNCV_3118581 [Trichonephila clavipes]
MGSNLGSLKTRRAEEPMQVKYVEPQMSSRWCGVEVRRGFASSEPPVALSSIWNENKLGMVTNIDMGYKILLIHLSLNLQTESKIEAMLFCESILQVSPVLVCRVLGMDVQRPGARISWT